MAQAYVCDRCDERIDTSPPDDYHVKAEIGNVYDPGKIDGVDTDELHLCENCSREFWRWLKHDGY